MPETALADRPARVAWDRLIQPDQVHGSLYTDDAIYQEELRRIWRRVWVYVGHASEIPRPHDYVMKSIGPDPVLMTRDADGAIHLLHNRCPHRGNQVCETAQGNTRTFTCNYHGWTFSIDGRLRGYPFPSGYADDLRGRIGLGRVPRVAIHKGFVFGSMAEDGPTLAEYLGGAIESLDALCRNSPDGEVELTAGFLQHKVMANWKFVMENETDGYHPPFTHASIFQVADSRIGELYADKSTAVTRYFGNGHSEVDLRPEFRRRGEPLSWFGTTPDKLPGYVARMNAAYGEDAARRIMIDGTPHVMIFPNLFIAEIQMFTIQPLSVRETVQHVTALQFKGAPDFNRRLRQQTMASVGPAGLLLADDAEMYERSHRGVQEQRPEWVYLARGNHRERRDEHGFKVGHATDDLCSRGMWQYYRSLMETE